MDTLYWFFQYLHVFVVYAFIMFIWPMVVFRSHLKTKSRSYRFAFCCVVMITLISLTMTFLGLVNLLNRWVLCILFYGVFFYSIFKGKRINRETIKRLKCFVGGTYGFKTMVSDVFKFIGNKIKQFWKAFLKFMEGHWFEYIALFIVLMFGVIYFTYGAFHDYSFGCGDVYVHCMWSYDLTTGTLFSSGIYPEGMHFFIAAQTMLTGVNLYSSVLFTGSITIFLTILSLFMFFREMFTWKYSPLLALLFFLVIDCQDGNQIFTVARMQWPLPMEFGYSILLFCGTYLIRYLRFSVVNKKTKEEKQAEKTSIKIPFLKKTLKIRFPLCLKDENLLIFTLALAGTVNIHFYDTIMAFYLCLGIAFALIHKVLTRKLVPLIVSVILGMVISVGPLVICFISGIELNYSLNWAMSYFMPSDPDEVTVSEEGASEDASTAGEEKETTEADTESKKEETAQTAYSGEYIYGNPVATSSVAASPTFISLLQSVTEPIKNFGTMLLETGYWGSGHLEARGNFYFSFMLLTLLIGCAAPLVRLVYAKIKKESVGQNMHMGYLIMALSGVTVHLFACSQKMGLPFLMEPYRIDTLSIMVAVPAVIVPVDFLVSLFKKWLPNFVQNIIVTGLLIAVYAIVRITGNFHGYLLYQLTRYNDTAMITKQIVSSLDDETYTIVSSTDELYQIMGKGYHEELVHFINESEHVSYTIPTPYIFIFVEKNALYRNQDHFFLGPDWLAVNSRYTVCYPGKESEGDNLRKMTISEDMANLYFGTFWENINVYGSLWQRTILNSKIYVWCQKFNAMYPNELHVYYEDEDFICYYLIQNQRNLYELATMDTSVMVPPEDYKEPIWPEDYREWMFDYDEGVLEGK